MTIEHIDQGLELKYNRPVPRYTSYPTVPFWHDQFKPQSWNKMVAESFSNTNHVTGISLYIHLPFCESLCTYCGCNKKITTNHAVEQRYIDAVLQEWKLYRSLMDQTPLIREIHIGGGTPTFFSPSNLSRLISSITKDAIIHPNRQFSVEGHPNNTTIEHLRVLSKAGFNRISFGVQDTDAHVQKIINRIQPIKNVKAAIDNARSAGFQSVNFDLIYGLPFQTQQSIERTINEVIDLKPDRIAFYSYAHVPWTYKAQRLFSENDLPSGMEKLNLYKTGKLILTKNGYTDIGMDHFALPGDELYNAAKSGKLHRNFMGYTTLDPGILLGLGVSSISDLGNAYGQNQKSIHEYYSAIDRHEIPIAKGIVLSEEDRKIKKHILDISCKGTTMIDVRDRKMFEDFTIPKLAGLKEDGLVKFDGSCVSLTTTGKSFVRNVCAAFDQYLTKGLGDSMPFSKAV